MSSAEFDELEAALSRAGAEKTLARLAEQFRAERKLHELFDVRLMQARLRLDLPAGEGRPLDELPEPLRTQAGEAYQAVCREVGELFLADSNYREAWMYLRASGGMDRLRATFETLEPNEENADQLIELALHDGVHVTRGFHWLLRQRGTCNAITAFESIVARCSRLEQQDAAAQLVRQLHQELLESVRSDISQQEKAPPSGATLAELIAGRDKLLEGGVYHTDTTHLVAVVRIARVVEDPEVLRLALDLVDYGLRLDPRYQFPGEEPFVVTYPAHRLFFQALLGQQVEESLAYFAARAEAVSINQEGPQSAEVYIYLLSRLGRHSEAVRAATRLLPPEVRTMGVAPSLWDLSRTARDYQPLMDLCRRRSDLVGFTAALIESKAQ